MTQLTRWMPGTVASRPTDLFSQMFNRFLSDDFFRPALSPTLFSEEIGARAWMPAVDIRETADSYLVYADLPGLTKEHLSITMENNVLTISGERRFERDAENSDSYHRVERSYGSFSRSFTLPSRVKNDEVQASFQDGVLTVTIPKLEEARPRQIAIN